MIGKYTKDKIVYHPPIYNYLTGGSWKSGWSKIQSTSGEIKYDYNCNGIEMIDGELYEFELDNQVAKIIRKVK